MKKWILVILEGVVGFMIGGFLGWCPFFVFSMIGVDLLPDLSGDTRMAIVLLVMAGGGIGCGLFYAKRALDAYEGRGKLRHAVLSAKDGKLELTAFSMLTYALLAVAWAFWVMFIQTLGRH